MPSKVPFRHPILTFYLLAFALSWTGYLPLLLSQYLHSPFWLFGLLLAAAGPALAAWCVSSHETGQPGGWYRLRASIMTPVPWSLWIAAVVLPVMLLLIANEVTRWALPHLRPEFPSSTAVGVLISSIVAIAANPWEEVGWRGFAQPRLESRYGFSAAALIVGVLWAAWHLPLFFLPGSIPVSMATIPFWPWAAGLVARSYLYAWLFDAARQNLAVVFLFHIAFNIFGALLGTRSLWVLSAVEIVAAAAILSAFARRGVAVIP